ncbi:MAG: sulfotransferase, partial [Actinomycetota bacterium]|nr:sulfotransferase [Actinomycetota bacterium]
GIIRDQQEVIARRNRLRVIRGATGDTDWAAMARMRAVIADVCSSLAEVTGARVIIDTSKGAHEAALLAAVGRIDHYVLYVVRDPRAVVYSWRRVKPVPISGGTTTMATRGLFASVGRWTENCLGAELLRRYVPHDRWLFLRYEDFVAAPRMSVDRVLAFVGVGTEGPFVSDDTVVLGTNHTVSGNPIRFRTGSVRIVEDDEWSARMARRDQMVIEAIAMPLLLRYGYPVRTAPRRARS